MVRNGNVTTAVTVLVQRAAVEILQYLRICRVSLPMTGLVEHGFDWLALRGWDICSAMALDFDEL